MLNALLSISKRIAIKSVFKGSRFLVLITCLWVIGVSAWGQIYNVTGGGTYCLGGLGVPVGLDGSQIGASYQLYIEGSTPVGSPVAGTGVAITFGNQLTAGTYTVMAAITPMTGYATVTINPLPTVTVNSSTVCQGTPATIIAIPGTTGTFSYAWTVPAGGTNPGNLATFNSTLAGIYSVVITNTTTNCVSASASGTVTVYPIPVITASPTSQSLCSGSPTSIALSSNVSGTTFAWTITPSGVSGASGGSGSSIVQTLTASGNTPGAVVYSVTPTANGCSGTPVNVTVTVNPIPVITPYPTSQSLCSGSQTSIALSSNVSGTTFAWTITPSGVSGASGGSGSSIVQTLTASGNTPGTVVYSVTPTANGCSGTPVNITVTVNPIPVVTPSPTSQSLCSGSQTSIALSSNVSGTTFAWTITPSGVSGASGGSGSSIVQTLTASGNTPGTVVYSVTPTANGCSGTPVNITVTVNPIPVVTPSPTSQSLCSGSPTSIALSSNVAGTTFAWTITPSGVSGASAGSGSSIAQTLTASGNTPGTVVYSVTPTANGCSGTPVNVTVTVNPIPVVYSISRFPVIMFRLTIFYRPLKQRFRNYVCLDHNSKWCKWCISR